MSGPRIAEGTVDAKERFTGREAAYVRFRPRYPRSVLGALVADCGLAPEWVISDVGTGTGFLAELFLRNGNQVYGVEPNTAMRHAGSRYLGRYRGFRSVDGSAEATTLASASIDLVCAGQAFHWFDPAKARAEFMRVLRPGGWVALVWNERRLSSRLERDYEDLLNRYAVDYRAIMASHIDPAVIRRFLAGGSCRRRRFDNAQRLDRDGFRGRLLSSSYCPAPGHPNHAQLMEKMDALFGQHARDGVIELTYDTRLFTGRL